MCGRGHRCLSYLPGHREQAYRTHAWHFQPCGCWQLGLATTSLGCFCAQLCKILREAGANRGPAEIRGRSRLRRWGLKSGILSADVGLASERTCHFLHQSPGGDNNAQQHHTCRTDAKLWGPSLAEHVPNWACKALQSSACVGKHMEARKLIECRHGDSMPRDPMQNTHVCQHSCDEAETDKLAWTAVRMRSTKQRVIVHIRA